MDKKQSIALYEQGKTAWNKWANGVLATKAGLEENRSWNARRLDWEISTTADFRGHKFSNEADFRGLVFPSDAWFDGATFPSHVSFSGTVFLGAASFTGATFFGNANFGGVSFPENASFHRATFFGLAGFNGTTFRQGVSFGKAKFIANRDQQNTIAQAARFDALKSEKFFNLHDAKFEQVPDFSQAHFLEAPNLDSIVIGPKARENKSPSPLWGGIKGGGKEAIEIPSRWRHLRRLATQGQDHENEQNFFAEELKSRRGVFDFPMGENWQRWWAGKLYGWLSDFGRSIWRPLWIWLSATLAYAFTLLATHDFIANNRPPFELGLNGCFLGDSTPWSTALKLAFDNAIFLPQFGVSNAQAQENLCLFGYDIGLKMPNLPPVPLVPGWITVFGFAHALFSLILVFLILLAIRNQFRIR